MPYTPAGRSRHLARVGKYLEECNRAGMLPKDTVATLSLMQQVCLTNAGLLNALAAAEALLKERPDLTGEALEIIGEWLSKRCSSEVSLDLRLCCVLHDRQATSGALHEGVSICVACQQLDKGLT